MVYSRKRSFDPESLRDYEEPQIMDLFHHIRLLYSDYAAVRFTNDVLVGGKFE